MMRWMAVWAFVLLGSTSVALAQDTPGAGKLEIGFFPGGGLFFVGGDNNLEANSNVYTAGGYVSLNLHRLVAVEGEGSFGLGLAQDVHYANTIFLNAQVPNTVAFNGNVLVFPV